jgi:putative phosphoesterase
MRVALISDLHSNWAALKAVLKDMPRVERVICAGDLVGYYAEPDEVVEEVRKKKILTVRGDHDWAVTIREFQSLDRLAAKAASWTCQNLMEENLNYLKTIKEKLEFSIKGNRFFVVHGSPSNPLAGRVPPGCTYREVVDAVGGVEADIIVLGHTHLPTQRMIFGKLILNPGSVGQPRDKNPKASYALLKLGKGIDVDFRRVEYDVESTAKAVRAKGLPDELAARLFFGW